MSEARAGIQVKICGLVTPESMTAALDAGADMVGLNFHKPSPRYIAPEDAGALADMARGRAETVALLVDPDDGMLDTILRQVDPDIIQLHGRETPHRVADIRAHVARPVMKVIGVASRDDLGQVGAYWSVSDRLLLDAKPPKDAAYPGGHGRVFDWSLLDGLEPAVPFMLAGGLTPENVADAIRRVRRGGSRLVGVDVASGVESAPGVKDIAKIRNFILAAHSA